MIKLNFILLFILSAIMSSCSYEDINRVLFVTTLIIDVEEEEVVIYIEIFHAFRSNRNNAEMGQRIIYTERARSIREALQKIDKSSSRRLVFSQNRVVLFSERAVEAGIDSFLDFLIRDQQMVLRPYVGVLRGEPKDFIGMEIQQNELIGLFLFDVMDRPLSNLVPQHFQIYNLINKRLMGSRIYYLTAITVEKSAFQDKITMESYALLKDDKLVTYVEDLETLKGLSLLLDTVNQGILTIEHPHIDDSKIVLWVLSSKTITDVSYIENNIHLKKTITTRVTVDAVQEGIVMNKENTEKIKKYTEEKIIKKSHKAFNLLKEENLDIFNIELALRRKYPQHEFKDAIKNTKLELNVRVILEGASGITDFNPHAM